MATSSDPFGLFAPRPGTMEMEQMIDQIMREHYVPGQGHNGMTRGAARQIVEQRFAQRGNQLNELLEKFKDPPAPTPGQTTKEVMEAFTGNLPALFDTLNKNIGPEAAARLASLKQTAPGEAQLNYDLFSQYGPKYQQIQNQMDHSAKQASAEADWKAARGPGALLVQELTNQDRNIVNPEYYKTMGALAGKTQDILSGLNPNELSGGERAEVERAANYAAEGTGNLGVGNATNTVNNAMHFGKALMDKKSKIAGIVQGLGSNLGSFKTQAPSPFGRPQTQTGATAFQPVQSQQNQSYNTGANFMNQIGNFASQANEINSGNRDGLDRLFQLQSMQNIFNGLY